MTIIEPLVDRSPGSRNRLRYRVTGTPGDVASTVALVRDSGHLISCTVPRHLGSCNSRVTVIVVLRDLTASRTTPRGRNRRPIRLTAVVCAAVFALVSMGYTLSTLPREVAAPVVIGGASLLVLLVRLIRTSMN